MATRAMRGWAGESSPDPAQGACAPCRFFALGVYQGAQRRRVVGGMAPSRCIGVSAWGASERGETPAHFAFQFVREAARIFLAAQCALSPFTRVGAQIVVLQFSYVHGWLDCADALEDRGLWGFRGRHVGVPGPLGDGRARCRAHSASSRLRRLAPFGLPSFPPSGRLTPPARLPASGLRASLAVR